MKKLYFIILSLIFIQCDNSLDVNMTSIVALAPVYIQLEIGDNITEESRPFNIDESIGYYSNFLLVIENGKGIHIIDDSDVDNPIALSFLSLPGISDALLQDEILFAKLANHFLTIELLDVSNSMIISIVDQPSSDGSGSFPEDGFEGKFECVDLTQGIVLRWEMKTILNPQCEVR